MTQVCALCRSFSFQSFYSCTDDDKKYTECSIYKGTGKKGGDLIRSIFTPFKICVELGLTEIRSTVLARPLLAKLQKGINMEELDTKALQSKICFAIELLY